MVINEVKERLESHKKAMLEVINTYLNALQQENRNADETDVIMEILKGMGYEYHEGQGFNGEYPHFFIKDTDLIEVILTTGADEEKLEEIRGL